MDRERFVLLEIPADITTYQPATGREPYKAITVAPGVHMIDVSDLFDLIGPGEIGKPRPVPLIVQAMTKHDHGYTVLVSWWEWSNHAEEAAQAEVSTSDPASAVSHAAHDLSRLPRTKDRVSSL